MATSLSTRTNALNHADFYHAIMVLQPFAMVKRKSRSSSVGIFLRVSLCLTDAMGVGAEVDVFFLGIMFSCGRRRVARYSYYQ